ncbi:MAG: PKD domain-containing protein [Candidatus Zixiibacteriota bacterium]|nr:MAG: PKD domain-containing protein [candidate division Zixibacteria bacterium]
MKSLLTFIGLIALLAIPHLAAGENLYDGCESVAYDANGNRYLATSGYNGSLVEIDSNGIESVYMDGFGMTYSNCVCGDTVYVTTGTGLVGIDMTNDSVFLELEFPVIQSADGVTTDTAGNVYVVDTGGRIYKVYVSDSSYTTFVYSGLAPWTQDAIFDKAHNRLLVAGFSAGAPVQAIDLEDSSVSNVVVTPYGFYDGITMDDKGNTYLSYATADQVIVYDGTFTNPPTLFSSGHSWPAGTDYNPNDEILAVANFEGNRVDFVHLYLDISTDVTWGQVPLQVEFTGSSRIPVDSWTWYFGDGETALIQSPTHTYQTPGAFDVTLETVSGEETHSYTSRNLIYALADTIAAVDTDGDPGEAVEVDIYVANTIPLNAMYIPITYQGALELTLDSFKTEGCRTAHFDELSRTYFNEENCQAYFKISNNPEGSTPGLDPGQGTILKLYLTIPPTATPGNTSAIELVSFSTKVLRFYSQDFYYAPIDAAGEVSLSGLCGDADGSEALNILDVTYLVNYLYKNGPAPEPENIGDADGSGTINILDVTHIVNYLYKEGPEPVC